jgi:hypothetical protein
MAISNATLAVSAYFANPMQPGDAEDGNSSIVFFPFKADRCHRNYIEPTRI